MTSSVTTTVAAPEPVYLSRHRDDEPASAAEKTSLQRLSHGVTLQGVPSFTSVELQRRWMLEHLTGAFRVFARKGYSEGLAGHISLRDPGEPAGCLGWSLRLIPHYKCRAP